MSIIWNMLMILLGFMMAVRGVKPRHPIFQEAPPVEVAPVEDPDEEEEDDDLEDATARKKRFKKRGAEDTQAKLFGRGIDFTAREKKFLLKIWDNIEEYWAISNCEVLKDNRRNQNRIRYRQRPADVHQFFREITGVADSTLSKIKKEMKKNDEKHGPAGMVMPSNRTGVKRKAVNHTALEVVLPDMDEFIRDEIIEARKGGHLTVRILATKATAYFTCNTIRPQRMRRALKRMGFEYDDRKGWYVNRRNDPKNLEKLRLYCEWVYDNVIQQEGTGLYTFKMPVAFGDGANEYTNSFRGRSWMLRKDPVLSSCEKSRKKDSGERVNMLGAIYSHSFDMNSMTAWNSKEKGKNSYAKGADIMTHTLDHVLPNLPYGTGAVYVLDNASNNKKVEDDLKHANNEELHEWINEHDPDQQRFDTFWNEESLKNPTAAQEKKMLFKYIRDNIDELSELAVELRRNSVELKYLPAYFPECNPIELIWAHIKREYKATDSKLHWKQRLDMAHAKITEEQMELAIDKSIRYCLTRLEELRTDDNVHDGGEDKIYEDDEAVVADSEDEWLEHQ